MYRNEEVFCLKNKRPRLYKISGFVLPHSYSCKLIHGKSGAASQLYGWCVYSHHLASRLAIHSRNILQSMLFLTDQNSCSVQYGKTEKQLLVSATHKPPTTLEYTHPPWNPWLI